MSGRNVTENEMKCMNELVGFIVKNHADKSVRKLDLDCVFQGWGKPAIDKNIIGTKLCLGDMEFDKGIGTHCDSDLKVTVPPAAKKFQAWVGIDRNKDTDNKSIVKAVFSVIAGGKTLWESRELGINDAPQQVDVDITGLGEFHLVTKAAATIHLAHVDWADAKVIFADGSESSFASEGVNGFNFYQLPVSFTYGGVNSASLMKNWDFAHSSRTDERDITVHTVTSSDPKTGLECELEIKQYPDFPAIWYSVKFRNTGNSETPILENIRSLDLKWSSATSSRIFVNRWNGSNLAYNDTFDHDRNFLHETIVLDEVDVHMKGQLGRCSGKWLPFFNVEQGNKGLFVAVGWSGQWDCDIKCDTEFWATISAGMEQTHLKLLPGEEISQPSIMLMYLDDNNPIRRSNIFRDFMRKYIIPRIEGKPAVAPMSCLTWGGMHTKFHLDCIAEIKKNSLPYDIYWIDAGWYGPEGNYSPDEFSSGWAEHTGNWSVNPTPHPDGLKVISDAAHKAGMKFMVWIEPERACKGTPLTIEHPDWFISPRDQVPAGESVLLNLGNADALKWLTQFVSDFIRDNGLDAYRQDFNYMPLAAWRKNDSPDRQGITEIRHIEGLYAFWDALRKQYPNLLIDNCASGGRRIDIETMSRSLPLWSSDVQCHPTHNPDASQTLNLGMNSFFSGHAIGTGFVPGDTYRFRSAMNEGMGFMFMGYEKFWKDYEKYPMEWHKRMCKDFVRAREYYKGDFYPLLEQTPLSSVWCAYEFWRSDLDSGIAMFFRRQDSPMECGTFKMHVPDEAKTYILENADTYEKTVIDGKTLANEGMKISLEPRQSCLLFITISKL